MGLTPQQAAQKLAQQEAETYASDNAGRDTEFRDQYERRRKLSEGSTTPGKRTFPSKENSKILKYPSKMMDTKTDYLKINVVEYKPIGSTLLNAPGSRSTTTNNSTTLSEANKKAKRILRTIFLPIPSNVQDGNSVNYEDSGLNGILAGVAAGAGGLMKNIDLSLDKDSRSNTIATLQGAFNTLIGSAGGATQAQELVNKLLVSQAVGVFGGNVSINNLLAREEGVIFNPNMELLFNGPTLRQFRFSFKMTPRNGPESGEIKEIIREFKRSMAPKVVQQGQTRNLFLKTPDVFELFYMTGAGEHKFLHKFKQCALTDMSVNYTGEGTYATYGGPESVPISMVMDLTFKELEPVYDIDYDNVGGVGY
jgi:hypothetical protein